MSKSKYITGQKAIEQLDIEPIEFFNDHIKNGLQPLNQIEQALSPSDILETIHDYQNLLERGATLTGDDTEAEDIKERIEKATKSIGAIVEVDWEDFDLPGYEPDAEVILTELLNALYIRSEIKGLRKAKAIAAKPLTFKERPSNEHERQCIKIALRFWKKDPDLHPREIARSNEIKEVAITKEEHIPYSERGICEWITPHWENHYFGVPKKRLKKS